MRPLALVFLILAPGPAATAAGPAPGQMDHGHAEARPRPRDASRDVRCPVARFSAVPSTTFDASGRLWAAWVEGDHVWVSSSPDTGRSWGKALAVADVPAGVDDNGEGRPKIAAGPGGTLYVTFTEKLALPYTGNVRFTRSVDGGRTFTPPMTLNGGGPPTGHRFDTLVAGPGSRVTVAWLDKRERDRAKAEGRPYAGAALYAIVSTDGGATFLPERKLADNVCECCRMAGAIGASGRTFLFLRGIFGERTRDHGLISIDARGASDGLRRVTFDGWELDGCPHHGPALGAGGDGTLHLAWFTGQGAAGRGLFYARASATGAEVGAASRVPGSGPTAGRPAVLASGKEVIVAWLENDGGVTRLLVGRSVDGGATFAAPREAGRTTEAADQPFLVRGPGGAWLSWFNDADGLVVTPIEG